MSTVVLIAIYSAVTTFAFGTDVNENYTCDSFGGQQWLNASYDINLAQFSSFWTSNDHWFTRMRPYIIEGGFTFPILEATNWNESEWHINPNTARVQRYLLYDINPKSAFVDKSTVNETQIIISNQSESFFFLRTLTNEGFPFADTFQVEFLLCAREINKQVYANVYGKIVEKDTFYKIIQGTVEDGVFKGAEEYYGIFNYSLNTLIHKLNDIKIQLSEQPELRRKLFKNATFSKQIVSPEDIFQDMSLDAVIAFAKNHSSTTNGQTDSITIVPKTDRLWDYDILTVFVIGTVALVLIILTFAVRRQKV